MSTRSRAAVEIWRARNVRTAGDRGYAVYLALMVGLVTVIPVARAVWLSATSAAGVAAFASSAAPAVTVLAVAALWAGALQFGRSRGPALLPPFLTHSLATSDLPRSETFRAPLLRAGIAVTVVTTIAGGLVSGSLLSHGLADPLALLVFTVAGALTGVIATVAWLAGQVFPRAAVPVALGVLALGAVTAVFPVLQQFTPWGWVGLTYPGGGSASFLAALTALTAAVAAAVPMLMNRLSLDQLSSQAARWESATTHATGMDFAAMAAVYRGRPRLGRHVRAIRPMGRLWLTFLIRDAIGAARTPGRLIVGVLALASAGVLIAFAFTPASAGWLLGAAAGILVFAGLGPLTDGIRHATSVALDMPLYGISDEYLLASHALFPLVVAIVLLLAVVIVCSLVIGIPAMAPVVSTLILGMLALTARVGNALKGSLPTALLTPIPTPIGDLSAAARMAWAVDGLLLVTLAGTSAVIVFDSPFLLVAVSAALVGIALGRWRRRG